MPPAQFISFLGLVGVGLVGGDGGDVKQQDLVFYQVMESLAASDLVAPWP